MTCLVLAWFSIKKHSNRRISLIPLHHLANGYSQLCNAPSLAKQLHSEYRRSYNLVHVSIVERTCFYLCSWPIPPSLILEAELREKKRFWGTLAARFIDVFAAWMWQVLLGYMWTAGLSTTPASGDKFFGEKHTPHSVKVAETLQELYECSLSCQGTLYSPSLTAGTKWWRVYAWPCQQLKIPCRTCGKTLKSDSNQFVVSNT